MYSYPDVVVFCCGEQYLGGAKTRSWSQYVRQSNGKWILTTYARPEDVMALSSVPATLKLADIYENVLKRR